MSDQQTLDIPQPQQPEDSADAIQASEKEEQTEASQPQQVSLQDLPAALEAVLMVVSEPTPIGELARAVSLDAKTVEQALHQLAASYEEEGRGFELREVAGGWRIYSSPRFDAVVADFVIGGQSARLTQAALETLAVVAYRQPVSRGRIAAIRGVNVDSVVRTLTARGLITEVGQETSGAILYGTTEEFLERMGMRDLEELAPLAPYMPALEELEEYTEGELPA